MALTPTDHTIAAAAADPARQPFLLLRDHLSVVFWGIAQSGSFSESLEQMLATDPERARRLAQLCRDLEDLTIRAGDLAGVSTQRFLG